MTLRPGSRSGPGPSGRPATRARSAACSTRPWRSCGGAGRPPGRGWNGGTAPAPADLDQITAFCLRAAAPP